MAPLKQMEPQKEEKSGGTRIAVRQTFLALEIQVIDLLRCVYNLKFTRSYLRPVLFLLPDTVLSDGETLDLTLYSFWM
jgi:hypothetical protein